MKKYVLEIEQDENPMSPRTEWDDNVTTMVCFHSRYNLGDKTDYKSNNFDSWDELKQQIESDHKVLMIKPLYMYDHSGITISTSPFGCQWDSGQIGWVFVDEKKLKSISGEGTYTDEEINEWIKGDVETYDNYLTGEVYCYSVYEVSTCSLGHEHKVLLESCGGYYGEECCREEGQSMLEHLEKEINLVN